MVFTLNPTASILALNSFIFHKALSVILFIYLILTIGYYNKYIPIENHSESLEDWAS